MMNKGQQIANAIWTELGIDIGVYSDSDIEFLKSKLEEFIDLNVSTYDLDDVAATDGTHQIIDEPEDTDELSELSPDRE